MQHRRCPPTARRGQVVLRRRQYARERIRTGSVRVAARGHPCRCPAGGAALLPPAGAGSPWRPGGMPARVHVGSGGQRPAGGCPRALGTVAVGCPGSVLARGIGPRPRRDAGRHGTGEQHPPGGCLRGPRTHRHRPLHERSGTSAGRQAVGEAAAALGRSGPTGCPAHRHEASRRALVSGGCGQGGDRRGRRASP